MNISHTHQLLTLSINLLEGLSEPLGAVIEDLEG